MVIRASLLALALCGASPAIAGSIDTLNISPRTSEAAFSATPSEGEQLRYRAIFAALEAEQWDEAKARILSLDEQDIMRPFALAELYLARNSPKVELFDLLALIDKARWLPHAEQLGRLAQKRGAQMLPELPQVQKLVWLGSAPRRQTVASVKTEPLSQELSASILPLIKEDNPAGAEAELMSSEPALSPEGRTEWRQRVAWSYYIENDDANARRMAVRALDGNVGGDWATQAYWTIGLAAWRQKDYRAAAPAFANVAARAGNQDMRAAGAYWAARAWMNSGDPMRVATLLRSAARHEDTFYGMLARETLGMAPVQRTAVANFSSADWAQLQQSPNVRAAVALSRIGQVGLADKAMRHEARIGGAAEYDALLRLATALDLPATQLWLAHNGPAGKQPDRFARFPAPSWKPDGGWRVDPALVFAHTLQESGFRTDAVSAAGARGLMQVRPGTAGDMAGTTVTFDQLHNPAINMEYGQRYLERLRDMSATGGLLPKVMAAYNAGPTPVERWNSEVRDGGDPLLFIESLPYYETRAYVNIVMRNYWMYQLQARGTADCLTGVAQGLWPRFPGPKGTTLVRISSNGFAAGAD